MANERKFAIGAQVRLKSYGPVMTVDGYFDPDKLQCQWFDGNKLMKGDFSAETLVEVDDEGEPIGVHQG